MESIGVVSVIKSYLSKREEQRLNLLNNRIYWVVLPAISPIFPLLDSTNTYGPWLDWGSGEAAMDKYVGTLTTTIG